MPEQTSEHRIILADQTTLDGGRAGLADGFLWLWIPGIEIQDAPSFAFDPEKMSTIRYQHGTAESVFEGFSKPYHLMTSSPGEISVCMVKAVSE